jgi:hypothetical protein
LWAFETNLDPFQDQLILPVENNIGIISLNYFGASDSNWDKCYVT